MSKKFLSANITNATINGSLNLPSGASLVNNSHTLILPGSTGHTTTSGIIPATDTTDTLTNKTITGTTNTVSANSIHNGSTWTLSMGGSAPTSNGLVLSTATNGSTTSWATNGYTNTGAPFDTSQAETITLLTLTCPNGNATSVNGLVIMSNKTNVANSAIFYLQGAFTANGGTASQLGSSSPLITSYKLSTVTSSASLSTSGGNIIITGTATVSDTLEWIAYASTFTL